MANKIARPADDPRFHYEIWSGPTKEHRARVAGIYYVENHNGQCGYAELAFDFKFAADLAISEYRQSGLANWTAPVAHLVRQTIELQLKSLLQTTVWKGNEVGQALLDTHDLKGIWKNARDWLVSNGYRIQEDARLDTTEWFITAFHEIDPSGDLFRFGISKRSAFGKQKSYDRIGIRLATFVPEFETTYGCLDHWEAVPMREIIGKEMGWETDPFFDANDFPRKVAESVDVSGELADRNDR